MLKKLIFSVKYVAFKKLYIYYSKLIVLLFVLDCVITPSGQPEGNRRPHNDDSGFIERAER